MSNPAKLTEQELAYINELATDIATHGGLQGATFEHALIAAHGRRQAFAAEMARGETQRAKMAAKALCVSVWTAGKIRQAEDRMLRQCGWIQAGME